MQLAEPPLRRSPSCSARFLERVHHLGEFHGGYCGTRQSNIESRSGYRSRSGSR